MPNLAQLPEAQTHLEAICRVTEEIRLTREKFLASPSSETENEWRERRAALAYLLHLRKRWIAEN